MGRPLRRSVIVGALLAPAIALVSTSVGTPIAAAATVPAGFVDTPVASVTDPTTIVPISTGRAVVLDQNGSVRVLNGNTLVPTPALTLSVCGGGGTERGLLGFAADRDFTGAGNVFVYYTRSVPGGCVNRVSRFFMNGDTIDAATEAVLLDNISSVRQPQRRRPRDRHRTASCTCRSAMPAATHAATRGRRSNDAAQDLRRSTARSCASPPTASRRRATRSPARGPASCATRGTTPSTPTNACQEIFACGLRNPYRFAFDRNDRGDPLLHQRRRPDAPGRRSTAASLGANYGWNAREGRAPAALNPPCAGPPAGRHRPAHRLPALRRHRSSPPGHSFPTGSGRRSTTAPTSSPMAGSGKIWVRLGQRLGRLRRAVRHRCRRDRGHGVRPRSRRLHADVRAERQQRRAPHRSRRATRRRRRWPASNWTP